MGHTIGNQIDDLVGSVDDARLFQGCGVIAEAVHDGLEGIGHVGARELYGAAELFPGSDRHDAGQNRHVDAPVPHAVQKVIEGLVAEEHLGREEVAAGVNFIL